jgi:cold shock CspA family protein
MPLIDQNLIAGYRLVISNKLRINQYKHLLRMQWEPAKGLKKTTGTSYRSGHVQNVTGGRQACSMFVSDSERHILQIVTLTEQGYGFARDFNLNDATVFVHINDAEIQTLRQGQIISAIVSKTPKGFQARSIRAA